MKIAELLPKELSHDSRLVYQRTTGHYYLCVPMILQVHEGPFSGRLTSLDPGVRTFLTGYTPDGEVVELGSNDIGHICFFVTGWATCVAHIRPKISAVQKKGVEDEKGCSQAALSDSNSGSLICTAGLSSICARHSILSSYRPFQFNRW
ncbi:hypothetical protein V1515DRAFT_593783 [Lipomyces mesembrius]